MESQKTRTVCSAYSPGVIEGVGFFLSVKAQSSSQGSYTESKVLLKNGGVGEEGDFVETGGSLARLVGIAVLESGLVRVFLRVLYLFAGI